MAVAALLALPVVAELAAPAPAVADETVNSCGSFGAGVMGSVGRFGYQEPAPCHIRQDLTHSVPRGSRAAWQAIAPPGLTIVAGWMEGIYATGFNGSFAACPNCRAAASPFGGGVYWLGARGGPGTEIFQTPPAPTSRLWGTAGNYFGMQIVCGANPCKPPPYPVEFDATHIGLEVRETTGPSLVAPAGLWQTSSWVRSTWPVVAWGNSPSGLCSLAARLNGQLVGTSSSRQDVSSWHQCAAPPIGQPVDTSHYGQGAVPLTVSAADAAGVPASVTKMVYIDNSQPSVAVSGPTDAPSTAGTQFVTATALAGPSAVAGIACSTDNAPPQWYPSTSAQVPVSGVGQHSVRCAAMNNAVDPAGNHGWSNWSSWSLKIGDPTISGITFGHVVDALRCRRVSERIRVPARWVTVRRHHKPVRVKRSGHVTVKKVTKCHPRTKIERVAVRVRVRRHGRQVWITRHERERVVVLPHLEHSTKIRVRHGKTVLVTGWLGTYGGVALAGQPVTILTAPNNGLGLFAPAAVATTAVDGTWAATLPAGPSRLVEAVYNGGPITEGSASSHIILTVPAKIRLLSIFPRRVAWGGTVRITGQLLGGYLPPGGALVRLRIGQGREFQTYGVQEHVTGSGRFTTAYTFGAGYPGIFKSFWFQIASLPMGNYPYAPAASGRGFVLVGGHPPPSLPVTHRRHAHQRTRRRKS